MTQSSIVRLLKTSSMVPLGSFFAIGLSTRLASAEERISSRWAAFFSACSFQCFLVSSWRRWYLWNWWLSTASECLYPSLKSDKELILLGLISFPDNLCLLPSSSPGMSLRRPASRGGNPWIWELQWNLGQSWYRYNSCLLTVRYQPWHEYSCLPVSSLRLWLLQLSFGWNHIVREFPISHLHILLREPVKGWFSVRSDILC